MPNFVDRLGVGRERDEMAARSPSSAPIAVERPVARGGGVGHRLERGEGLGGDDEQRLVRVEVLRSPSVKSAPSTLATKRTSSVRIAERAQRAVGHLRPEIGAADADIDDVADALAAVPGPGAGAHLVGEGRHPVEHRVDLGHDVLAVDEDRLAARRPQRHMQHGAVLADVDLLAGEHRVAPRSATPRARARSSSRRTVSSVMRFFE